LSTLPFSEIAEEAKEIPPAIVSIHTHLTPHCLVRFSKAFNDKAIPE